MLAPKCMPTPMPMQMPASMPCPCHGNEYHFVCLNANYVVTGTIHMPICCLQLYHRAS